jgi:hypothetical protein
MSSISDDHHRYSSNRRTMEQPQDNKDATGTVATIPRRQPQPRAVVAGGAHLGNIDQVTWADVAETSDGQALTVAGSPLTLFLSKQLRTICSRLSLRGVKNATKKEMIDKIVTTYRSLNASQNNRGGTEQNQQLQQQPEQQHSPLPTSITTRTSTSSSSSRRDNMDLLQQDEDATSTVVTIPPPLQQQRAVAAAAAAAGGVHDKDLEKVTWADVAANSEGQALAVAGYPLASFSPKQLRTICRHLSVKGVKNAKKKEMVDKIVDRYRIWNTSQNNRGITERHLQKEPLGTMQIATSTLQDLADQSPETNSTVAKVKVQCLLNEEARRDKEEVRREQEEKRREKEHKLAEWEKITQNLRALRQDLANPLIDEEDKNDIQEDIRRLRKRKNTIAVRDLEMDDRGAADV